MAVTLRDLVDAIPTQVHGVVMAIKGISCSHLQAQHILPSDGLCTSTGDPRKSPLPRSYAEKNTWTQGQL